MIMRVETGDQDSVSCSVCNRENTTITDPDSGEIVCNNCGMVISEKIEDITHLERRASASTLEVDRRTSTGAPSSLARHDRGLATLIGRLDKDAGGQKIVNSARFTFERLRTWDSRIRLNSSTDRNLSKAFCELHLLEDKLGL
jgi:transcription initiation factor TFIIB